jgi:hypothetical protein
LNLRFEGEKPSDADVVMAHGADLGVQEGHGVRFLKYRAVGTPRVALPGRTA